MENNSKYASSFKSQLTTRAIIIGAIGSVIITCSSMFVALRISSLPWPIMFVALASMFSLKALGNTNFNEINVAHTAMSAGAMVAGGLAFTLPGIWMLNPDAEVSYFALLILTLGGVILGLIFTATLRKHFIENAKLSYPMGQAAADMVVIGDTGGKKSILLFASMGITAVFTWLRDKLLVIPAVKFSETMLGYGSLGGVWFSPMLISIGYIIGPVFVGVWFLGALIGDVGILIGGQASGLLDAQTANDIKSSLGLGLMVGTGLGILIKEIFPRIKTIFASMFSRGDKGDSIVSMRFAPLILAALVGIFTLVLDLPIIASVVTVFGSWLAVTMSCQCVGQSGINPMEIFGIVVLILAQLVTGISGTPAFYIAAIVAVASGLTGDVMNDFKSGHILKTDPKAQWIAEVIGSIIGAVVSVFVLFIILRAYGGESFGTSEFPAAQSAAVAAMVGGVAHLPSFVIGLILAAILYIIGLPAMTLGLGVYLPFYLSATAFIGAILRVILDKFAPNFEKKGTGSVIASGALGGEAVVGVIIALITAVSVL